ncbi:metalloprotease [Lacinutrix iliipiscaria]|uniref:Metalloprotease n=1 Tax=Lacinutrix iliipiscaria TaxID=1230532 RepID=A0ABW5WQR3_9FLAO
MNFISYSQNTIDLKATFDIDKRQIKIVQTIQYQNTTNDVLQEVYLNDWSNSFSTKSTPLAIRLAEEYKNEFHFAKNEDRGFTVITSLKQDGFDVSHERLKDQLDIVKVTLNNPLQPNEVYTLQLDYIVQIPNSKFTRYGVSSKANISLRYWYITPAVYDGTWHYFSNKDLDDAYIPKANHTFSIEYPERYILSTELNQTDQKKVDGNIITQLSGNDRVNSKLYLSLYPQFNTVETDYFTIVSNIDDENLTQTDRVILTDKIAGFVTRNLGDYPHKKLLITNIDYKKSPIYGLNLLPDFIRPFPDRFQYELKLVKTTIRNYLENVLLINPRKDQWLIDGLQVYYLMKYVDEYYPNMKIFGTLSNIWGIKSFHASKLNFNDQYRYSYLNMAKTNIDQPLTMAKDSLLKFNKNIANPNKAAIGLQYLNHFDETLKMDSSLLEFINIQKLKPTSTKDFETLIKSKANKNVDWFFTDYLSTTKKIDYTIKTVDASKDSIKVTVKNKNKNSMPSALFELKKDSVLSKTWINTKDQKTITLAKSDATKLVINKDEAIPEINNRNNTKSLTKSLFNRPIQIRLIKDVEDPRYNQVFIMPIVEYNNIYDGLVLGVKPYNKSVLKKPFTYKLAPQYGLKSKSLSGSANIVYHQFINNVDNLYKIQYVLTGSYSSYAEDLFVTVFKPNITFNFRDTGNLRSNKRQYLNFRYVSIKRDKDVNNILQSEAKPNYKVFSIRFINNNPGLINYTSWFADFQAAETFSKVSFNYEYRQLFQNNRQLNVRVFAGVFLNNKNEATNDYFSFALDRPTDYLFDYQYLGRSESTGLFSQQIIIAEGGFKSKLETPFANQWMATANVSTSIWNYIHAYGDIGTLKNKHHSAKFVYDSGLRVNLVEDYFEIYFPVYSNLGWEISQPQYSQKIRFKFTADIQSLLGLFRRRWY